MLVVDRGFHLSSFHAARSRMSSAEVVAGISTAVLRARELVDLNCAGWSGKEQRFALRPDLIFRVFSSTKLITSIAVLLLFEEGHFKLDDPFIRQLASRRVLRARAARLDDTELAPGPITIRHLLSHSAGLSYGLFDASTLIFKAYNAAHVCNPHTRLAQMMDVLAGLPLIFHTGTPWEYSW